MTSNGKGPDSRTSGKTGLLTLLQTVIHEHLNGDFPIVFEGSHE